LHVAKAEEHVANTIFTRNYRLFTFMNTNGRNVEGSVAFTITGFAG